MKREEMTQTVKEIVTGVVEKERVVGVDEADVEDASEAILKVFEKSLEESISEAIEGLPRLGKLLKGVKK